MNISPGSVLVKDHTSSGTDGKVPAERPSPSVLTLDDCMLDEPIVVTKPQGSVFCHRNNDFKMRHEEPQT